MMGKRESNAPEMGEPSREWFRDWFGEEYLELYPHRDEQEARRAVSLYLATFRPPGDPVLDLACGAGRHLRELEASGLPTVGLDLSAVLLGEARRASPEACLVRADMRRLPFRTGAFGGLTSFFTSFGYFGTRDEDRRVAREIRRVLRDGGNFMLDFFNAQRVRDELVPRDERVTDGRRVTQTREIEDDTVVKRIRIREETADGIRERRFEERVRLYSPEGLQALLEDAALAVRHRYGDYHGGDFDPAAERLILAGVAA